MRITTAFALLCLALPAWAQAPAPQAAKPKAPAAKQSGSALLPLAERIAIQSDLIWTGDLISIADGEWGDRSTAAVKAFQKRKGGSETGVLTSEERAWLAQEMAREQAHRADTHATLGDAVRSGRLWALAAVYLCIVIAFYGITFWLPQIMQSISDLGSAVIVLLSAIPYIAATIGLVVIGRRSDRRHERRWHVAIPCLIGATGFTLTVMAPAHPAVTLATLSIAAFGIWGTMGPLWAMPTAMLRGTAAAGGIALVNSIGNIGGFAGPYLMGWIREATGGFSGGLLTLAAFLIAGALIVLRLQEPDERLVQGD